MPRCRRPRRRSSTITAPPSGPAGSPIRGRISSTPGIAKIKAEPGHEVYKITDEQLGEWKKSAEPLHQKWAAAVRDRGGNPDVIMSELKASLAQYKAAY